MVEDQVEVLEVKEVETGQVDMGMMDSMDLGVETDETEVLMDQEV